MFDVTKKAEGAAGGAAGLPLALGMQGVHCIELLTEIGERCRFMRAVVRTWHGYGHGSVHSFCGGGHCPTIDPTTSME